MGRTGQVPDPGSFRAGKGGMKMREEGTNGCEILRNNEYKPIKIYLIGYKDVEKHIYYTRYGINIVKYIDNIPDKV